MNRFIALLAVTFLVSCAVPGKVPEDRDSQRNIFKDWVLSRCLSYTLKDGEQKQDALNTASAYLEKSTLSVEQIISSEPLIKKYLSRNYQGSISGSFSTMKCIDLFNSQELDEMYSNFNN